MHFVLFAPDRLEIPAADAVTVGTIEDDDPSPILTAASPSAAESAGSLVFAVSLDRPSARDLNVPWQTSDQTAIAGEDYVGANGTLTFVAGDMDKTIAVTIKDDDVSSDRSGDVRSTSRMRGPRHPSAGTGPQRKKRRPPTCV